MPNSSSKSWSKLPPRPRPRPTTPTIPTTTTAHLLRVLPPGSTSNPTTSPRSKGLTKNCPPGSSPSEMPACHISTMETPPAATAPPLSPWLCLASRVKQENGSKDLPLRNLSPKPRKKPWTSSSPPSCPSLRIKTGLMPKPANSTPCPLLVSPGPPSRLTSKLRPRTGKFLFPTHHLCPPPPPPSEPPLEPRTENVITWLSVTNPKEQDTGTSPKASNEAGKRPRNAPSHLPRPDPPPPTASLLPSRSPITALSSASLCLFHVKRRASTRNPPSPPPSEASSQNTLDSENVSLSNSGATLVVAKPPNTARRFPLLRKPECSLPRN